MLSVKPATQTVHISKHQKVICKKEYNDHISQAF